MPIDMPSTYCVRRAQLMRDLQELSYARSSTIMQHMHVSNTWSATHATACVIFLRSANGTAWKMTQAADRKMLLCCGLSYDFPLCVLLKLIKRRRVLSKTKPRPQTTWVDFCCHALTTPTNHLSWLLLPRFAKRFPSTCCCIIYNSKSFHGIY